MQSENLTPLMKQYFNIRNQYPDTLLFFQVGDFYELFFDDARTASSFLAIALTKRGKSNGEDVPLCGIPVHALTHYLTKLVKGGFKVAICDQLSEPKPGTVVERAVTRVFTPGTLTDPQMLDEKSASYILSFAQVENEWALVFAELLTGQIFATVIQKDSYRILESELSRFFPDEVIVTEEELFFKKKGYWTSKYSSVEDTYTQWLEQFDSAVVNKIKNTVLNSALQLLHSYLTRTKYFLHPFNNIQFYQSDDYLYLDASTQRNLEIVVNNQDGSRKNSLLSIVDCAKTSMGSRTIKKWLTRPLLQKKMIIQRQEVVKAIKDNVEVMQKLSGLLSNLADLERIVGRIALQKASIQDYVALKQSLNIIPLIKAVIVHKQEFDLIKRLLSKLFDYSVLVEYLHASLEEDFSSGLIIKRGFDHNLDRIRALVGNSQKELLKLEEEEIRKTGINSLKIRYNNITGYMIEITKTHLDKIPEHYKRIQSLSNKERFIIKELLELQNEILQAQKQIQSLENEIFQQVKAEVYKKLSALRHSANALAYLDALYGFAVVAYENNYKLPVFNDNGDILIKEGRHPVIESKISSFIPNDTFLNKQESLWIITGPNMGGKSTYLRQVALMCILAQCGSLVPANEASLPIIDRIFTRIGSGDNLAEGKSTFLVEMEETSLICTQATKNSLVILDEVGRGTSTFDGLAIAQAVIEYIYDSIGAKCLFATHYHELTNLKEHFSAIVNYHMLCKKTDNGIIFLHKIEKGVSLGSFGIDVAKLAEMPALLINRARDILYSLENISRFRDKDLYKHENRSINSDILADKVITLENELVKKEKLFIKIREINLDDLTPRKALELLWDLKKTISS